MQRFNRYTMVVTLLWAIASLHTATAQVEPSTLKFDFPGVKIGTSVDRGGPTGVTSILFDKSAMAVVDLRGGAVSSRDTNSLETTQGQPLIDALVFAGSSRFGLSAADGVSRFLFDLRSKAAGHKRARDLPVPAVAGSVIYDFSLRENSVMVNAELGRKSATQARPNQFEIGRVGAGAGATVGKLFGRRMAELSGQGAYFIRYKEHRILAIVVLNAAGNVLGRQGQVIAGSLDKKDNQRRRIPKAILEGETVLDFKAPNELNSTLTAFITDAPLSRIELKHIAMTAHAALARVIEPFQTSRDGDAFYAITTNPAALADASHALNIGVVAGEAVQEAVWSIFKH